MSETLPIARDRVKEWADEYGLAVDMEEAEEMAVELVMDALARELGIETHEIRIRNLPPPEAMPYTNVMGKLIDSGAHSPTNPSS